MMITGMHTVSDIFCVGCGSIVGWKYVRFAKVISQCPLYIALHLTKFLWCSSLGGCTWEEPEIQGRKVYSGEVMAPTFYHSSVALDLFFQNKKKLSSVQTDLWLILQNATLITILLIWNWLTGTKFHSKQVQGVGPWWKPILDCTRC
jgi:hypothetical protein